MDSEKDRGEKRKTEKRYRLGKRQTEKRHRLRKETE